MDRQPKFAKGQIIQTTFGRKGHVAEVHAESVFFGFGYQTHYEYTVDFFDGSTERCFEAALELFEARKSACECGAHAVKWFLGHHSAWCPEAIFAAETNYGKVGE